MFFIPMFNFKILGKWSSSYTKTDVETKNHHKIFLSDPDFSHI